MDSINDLTLPPVDTPWLNIPASVRSSMLPPIWVSSLLQFSYLPSICAAPLNSSSPSDGWFSASPVGPDFDPGILVRIPVPPIKVINRLREALQTVQPSALNSVIPLHLQAHGPVEPGNLPLWVVSYWAEVFEVHRHRQDWLASARWVEKYAHGSHEGRALQQRILGNLDELRWQGSLCGGAVSGRSIQALSKFLGNHPLPGEQICQLLDLLRSRLALTSIVSPHILVDDHFIETLQIGSATPVSSIEADRRFNALRRIESDITHLRSTSRSRQ